MPRWKMMRRVERWWLVHWRQIGLWMACVWLLQYAVVYLLRDDEVWFWSPPMFLVAALLVGAFAAVPGSCGLYRAAGVAGMVALLARAFASLSVVLTDGIALTDARPWTGVITFAALATFWSIWWVKAVGTYHGLKEARHRTGD